MKLTSPFTILRDALETQTLDSPACFIDETKVEIKECIVPIEEKIEASRVDFWDEECEDQPTNSHYKVFDE